ncbi:hypothetical protein MP228_012449 [Amoeboaphelidium protococcarum]|nr:hypothetical protein MP228_012449 [Amoeboaphelidium protococcarum]
MTQDSEEVFELRVQNVGKIKQEEFQTLINSHGIMDAQSVKKRPSWDYAFIKFDSSEKMSDAQQKLSSIDATAGGQLQVEVSEGLDSRKRPYSGGQSRGGRRNKKAIVESENREQWQLLNDRTVPLWEMPYEQQCEQKQNSISQLIQQQPEFKDCVISDIIQSPSNAREHYRTKCEFSIGKDVNDHNCVGFMLGDYKNGRRFVSDASQCPHVCKYSIKISSATLQFINTKPHLPVYCRDTNRGFWRNLIVRSHQCGQQIMVILMLSQREVSVEDAEIFALMKEYCEYLLELTENVKTVQYTINDNMHCALTGDMPLITLHGDGYVYDSLRNLSVEDQSSQKAINFRISPMAFYQSNAITCELLYKAVGDIIVQKQVHGKKTVILDLCCGTGTIGIVMSQLSNVKHIYGIELCEPAIQDAEHNATLNNVRDKVTYICGPVEDTIEKLLDQVDIDPETDQVIAILDPPRAGVHKKVIKAIKQCKYIQSVIYVSCNPSAAKQNWLHLTQPMWRLSKSSNRTQKYPEVRSDQFVMESAQAVDMFPQTSHVELVLSFTRLSDCQSGKPDMK